MLVGRKPERLEAVRGEIGATGARASDPCDIREEAQVRAMVAETLARTGRIDGLVNNAGGQFAAPLASITQKGWETVVRTNLTGGFLCARECYTQWMAEHGGAIVNIVADMWGSMPGMGHSGAARAGMVSFTETAAVEWADVGRAGERGRAGLDRVVRHGHVPGVDAALPPAAQAGRAAAAARDGVGGVGGDLLPAVTGRRVHLGQSCCASTARRRTPSWRRRCRPWCRTRSARRPRGGSRGRCRRTTARRGRGTASTWPSRRASWRDD